MGDLVECTSYDHVATAEGIVKKIGLSLPEKRHSDDALMEAGWAYIGVSSLGLPEWRIGWKHFLTDYQKNFLKQYFDDPKRPVNEMARYRWAEENRDTWINMSSR